jgi:hypothetical protein
MATDISDYLRSEEGKRKGGHMRPEGSSAWAHRGLIAQATGTDPRGAAAHTVVGVHDPKPSKPLQPGATEAAPRGQKQAGATGTIVPASQRNAPPNTVGKGRSR